MKRKLDQELEPASTNQSLHQKVPPGSGNACPICGLKLSSVSSTESGQNAHVNACMDLAMASGSRIQSMITLSVDNKPVHDQLQLLSERRNGGGRRNPSPGKDVGISNSNADGHTRHSDSDDEDGGEMLCNGTDDHKKEALGRAAGGVLAASEMVDLTSDGDNGDVSQRSPGKSRLHTISLLSSPHPTPTGPCRSSISKW